MDASGDGGHGLGAGCARAGGVAFLVVLEGSVSIGGQTAGPRDAFRIEGAGTLDDDVDCARGGDWY